MALIDPLLTGSLEAGTSATFPGMVTPEHKVSGGWADLRVCSDLMAIPAATVEAKKLGDAVLKDDRTGPRCSNRTRVT